MNRSRVFFKGTDHNSYFVETRLWLHPLQTKTQKKTSNSIQLTLKATNFNFTTIPLKQNASVWWKNFRTSFHRKRVTNNKSLFSF